MKNLRLLQVSFDTHLQPWELPQFRGAVAAKVGLEHDWYHNHDNESGGFHHRYPKIQYKLETRGQQQHPMLLCVDEGIEEAHHFFSKPDWNLQIGAQAHDMRIARLDLKQFKLNVWEHDFTYRLHKWQALNTKLFAEWQASDSLADRFKILESALTSHLLSFARGVDWHIEPHFEVRITRLLKDDWTTYKDVKVMTFTVEFKTRLSLPDWIGLGKGGSTGFGVLRSQRAGGAGQAH